MANKKTKELPMEFNPALNKFEPILPVRKGKRYVQNKRINWWMIAGLIIVLLILITTLLINLLK